MADESSEQFKDLLHWAATRGISDAPPELENSVCSTALGCSLRIATFPDAGGRGLAAARDLKLGELILRVPEKALMNGKSARGDAELAGVLALHPSLSDVQACLTMETGTNLLIVNYIASEVLCVHLLKEIGKGRASEWYPYLVHLPRYYHTASVFSSFEALALQEKDAVAMAEEAARISREEWLGARPVLEKLAVVRRLTTLQAWRWASATISSRTLYVPWDEAGTLCPVGDLFNYACPGVSYDSLSVGKERYSLEGEDTSCGLEIRERLRDGGFERENGEYRFYARQDYQEGQQVLLCYGTYTNLELLEHYGFLLSFNPNNKVHIHLPSFEELNPCAAAALRVFQDTPPPKSLFIDFEGKPSFSLLSHLRLRSAPASLLKSRRHLALEGEQISPESDRIVYQWLKAECLKMLDDCATSSVADQLLLEVLNTHPSMSEAQKFLAHYKVCPSASSHVLLSAPQHLEVVVVEEVERFFTSVDSASAEWQQDLQFERWRLAVEWRLSYKKDCIMLYITVLPSSAGMKFSVAMPKVVKK